MAALARLPAAPDALDYFRTEPTPDEISLGTAVRVSPFNSRTKAGMFEAGVVMEVVPRGEPVRTMTGVLYAARLKGSRSTVTRYVVQCEHYRVVRRAAELVVVAL